MIMSYRRKTTKGARPKDRDRRGSIEGHFHE